MTLKKNDVAVQLCSQMLFLQNPFTDKHTHFLPSTFTAGLDLAPRP